MDTTRIAREMPHGNYDNLLVSEQEVDAIGEPSNKRSPQDAAHPWEATRLGFDCSDRGRELFQELYAETSPLLLIPAIS
jgi:hypothetical protein